MTVVFQLEERKLKNSKRKLGGELFTFFNKYYGYGIRFKHYFRIHNQLNAFMYSRIHDNASSAVPGTVLARLRFSSKIALGHRPRPGRRNALEYIRNKADILRRFSSLHVETCSRPFSAFRPLVWLWAPSNILKLGPYYPTGLTIRTYHIFYIA